MTIGEILPGIMDELKRGVAARKENMRLSNMPDGVTDKMIEDQSAECCIECEGTGEIESDDIDDGIIECPNCNGSGVEPKRFSSHKPDSWED